MKKDLNTGPRKYGCDMCGKGQRMLEYIEELEARLDELEPDEGEDGEPSGEVEGGDSEPST